MQKRVVLYALLAGMVALACTGCRKQKSHQAQVPVTPPETEPEPKPTLTLLCGGSFRKPAEQLCDRFSEQTGIKMELSFGQCEDLLPQIKIGKEGDLFLSHDPYRDYVQDAGALMDAVGVGYVAPVLVVRKGNPKQIKSIEDLAKPGVEVALTNPEYSTAGEMVFRLLEKKGIKEAVKDNAGGAIFRTHAQVGTAIETGGRDAGIMWNGIAHNFLDAIEIVETPDEYEKTIRMWIIGLNYTDQKPEVKQFMSFCKDHAKETFVEYGYVK